jgi:adenine/guanine phosphoribosyltransferase-like PRPP-binding protein
MTPRWGPDVNASRDKSYQGLVALPPDTLKIGAGYLADVYTGRQLGAIVRRAKRNLRDAGFDTMVGTGLSGALVVPHLARAMGKEWLLVRRKDDTSSHSVFAAEGQLGKRWLFVDDQVATGATQAWVENVVREISIVSKFPTVMAGVYEYRTGYLHGPSTPVHAPARRRSPAGGESG